MYKAPVEVMPVFPQLCAIIGDVQAFKIMRKLLSHEDEQDGYSKSNNFL
jgi:hypothetical protein